MQGLDDELRTAAGYEGKELDRILSTLDAGEIVEDEAPEPPAEPKTKPGDLWILGDHRLLCGDSTSQKNVNRLIGGAKATACITDPPYGGVLNKKSGHGKLKESALKYGGGDWDYRPSAQMLECLSSFNEAIIWGGNYFASDLLDARGWLVWDKKNGYSSFADAELAWSNIDQAVRIYREHISAITDRGHPTQKPVGLLSWCVKMTTGVIFDPFLGSGTTLIAAEQLGRKCYGMELSPQYCDVIVERWQNLTGKEAKLDA